MILTKKQLSELRKETIDELLNILYTIENQLCYKCKNVSKTINYIQNKYIGHLEGTHNDNTY